MSDDAECCSPSCHGNLAASREGEGQSTPVRGVAKKSRNGTIGGRDGRSHQDRGDRGVYSPPSPYSLPSTPSPPASPSSLPTAASPPRWGSRDPVGHASLSSGHRRKRRCFPETTVSEAQTTDSPRSSVTPRSRRRLLDVGPLDVGPLESSLESAGYVGEHSDLLSKADEVLERLRDNSYHSVNDFYSRNDHPALERSPNTSRHHDLPKNSDLQEYLNSELLDSDPPNSDLVNSDLSPARSNIRSTARLGRQVSHIHILSRAPAGPHVSVTGCEGDRVYLRLRDAGAGSKKAWEKFRHRKGLLTVPFAELKANVEEEVS